MPDTTPDLKKHFRHWTIPGPIPPGALGNHPDTPTTAPGETLDSLGGHYKIFQLAKGHRFSTDDVLTAWYGTSWAPTVRTALNLGSGLVGWQAIRHFIRRK